MKFLNKIKYLVIFIFHSSIFSEELIYSVSFSFFNAGEAIINSKSDLVNEDSLLLISSSIKTNRFLSKFYHVNDMIQAWVDPNDFSLIKINKNINEGSYQHSYSAKITDGVLIMNDQDSLILKSKVYSPISAIFMLRKRQLQQNDVYEFSTVGSGKIKEVMVKVNHIEKINVPAGSYDAVVVIPVSKKGEILFKNDGHMKVWYSTDDKHVPVQIEQQTNVGTLTMKLKKHIY